MEPSSSTSTTPGTSHSSSRNLKSSKEKRSVTFSRLPSHAHMSNKNLKKAGSKSGQNLKKSEKKTAGKKKMGKKIKKKKKKKKKKKGGKTKKKYKKRSLNGKKVKLRTKVTPSPRKLRLQIDKLDKENEILRQRVRKITDSITHTQSNQKTDLVNRLNEQADRLTVNCHHEKMKIKEYEGKLKNLVRDVEKARRRYGGILQDVEQESLLDKQLRVLENRLEAHLKKYNKLLSINREKRNEIEKLRGERKVFDKIYHKIENELHEKQRQLSKLIENSNHAFEERERIQTDLGKVRDGIRLEERKFDEKIKIIDEILQSDVKVNLYLKQQERRKFQMSWMDKEVSVEDQQNMKKSFIKGNWRLAEKRAKEIILKEKIGRLRKIFREIESKTFLSKEELIDRLQDAQHKYYQEFIFINKLNSEIEELEKQNEEHVEKIREMENTKKIDPEKRKLKQIQGNINSIQDNIFMVCSKKEEMSSLLSSVLPHVKDMCDVLGIMMYPGGFADETKIDVGMAIQQMFMRIEERTSHLMRLYFRKIRREHLQDEKDPSTTDSDSSGGAVSHILKRKVQCGSRLPKKGKLKFQINPPSSLTPIDTSNILTRSDSPTSGSMKGSGTGGGGSKGLVSHASSYSLSSGDLDKVVELKPLTRDELERSGLMFK